MTSLFELQIIESLIPLFDSKAEITEVLKIGALKPFMFGYIPSPFPGSGTLYLF